jgi:hypothetical protein
MWIRNTATGGENYKKGNQKSNLKGRKKRKNTREIARNRQYKRYWGKM